MTDEDVQKTKDAFFEADYFWVILSLLLAFLSHFSRAIRWRYLTEPLGYKPKLSNAFYGVMGAYVINYTVPRSGEFARAGLMTNYEKIPFEKGFATIVIERVIDVIMLGLVFFITGLLQVNSPEIGNEANSENSTALYWIIGGGAVLGIIVLIFYFVNEKLKQFVNEKLNGFWEGLKTIWTMKKKWQFILHTIFIWACYVGMLWVAAQAFDVTQNISVGTIFGMFVLGAAAIAAVPGGLGLYPLWLTMVLKQAEGIDYPAFGIFVWVTQTGLIVVLGLLSLFLIQRQSKTVTK